MRSLSRGSVGENSRDQLEISWEYSILAKNCVVLMSVLTPAPGSDDQLFLILARKVLHPGNPLNSRQTGTVGHPIYPAGYLSGSQENWELGVL